MIKIVPIFVLLSIYPFLLAHAQNSGFKTVDEYINNFKDIAIREMERSGVPASIKLAQGIHESGFGNSQLAKEANNHFGIKCGNDWKGESFQKVADDISISCFRKYASAETSYIDHTELLLTRKHYKFLFDLDRKDYKSWAHGLRKAGYASDPKYPEKLITAIEKYKLAQYDTMATPYLVFDDEIVLDDNDETVLNATINANRNFRTKARSFLFTAYRKGLFRQNNSTYVVAKNGESALAAADRFGIPYQKFLKFNDLIDGDKLIQYQYLYIQPKKSSYKGDAKMHKVQNDETMYEIAQYYGIRLEALLQRNRMQLGEEPANGELILLGEKALSKPALRPKNHIDALPDEFEDKDYGVDSAQWTNAASIMNHVEIRPDTNIVVRPTSPTIKDEVRFETAENTVRAEDTLHFKMPSQPIVPSVPTPAPSTGTISSSNTLFPSPNNLSSSTTSSNSNIGATVNSNTMQGGMASSLFPKINNTTPTPSTPTISQPIKPESTPAQSSTPQQTVNTQPNTSTSKQSQQKGKYKVVSGDSLSKIAKLYKTTIAELKALNKMKTDNIYVGQTLIVPL